MIKRIIFFIFFLIYHFRFKIKNKLSRIPIHAFSITLLSYWFQRNSFSRQFLFNSSQVRWVRVPEWSHASRSRCFVMNTIPYCLVVHSRCHTTPHCKYQFSLERFSEKLKHFPPLLVIWQVGCSWSTCKRFSISVPAFHVIINHNSTFSMTRNVSKFIKSHIHVPLRLISFHDSKNCWAYRTLGPIFLPNKVFEASQMEHMGTFEHVNIIVVSFIKLILELFVGLDFELTETDGALFLLHFGLGKGELERGEVFEVELFSELALVAIFLIVG